MFNTNYDLTSTEIISDNSTAYGELNRLLSAAIVSANFRSTLLNNPEIAIAKGYQGEKFNLTSDQYRWLTSIKAIDLAGFAKQLVDYQHARTPEHEVVLAVNLPEISYVGRTKYS